MERKERQVLGETDTNPSKRQYIDFNWSNCFICGKGDNKHKKLSVVCRNAESVKEKVLNAAKIRLDTVVQERLSSVDDLSKIEAHYHRYCYQNYIARRSLQVFNSQKVISIYDEVAEETAQMYIDLVKEGRIIFLCDLCKTYREKIATKAGIPNENINNMRSNFIKRKILQFLDEEFIFISNRGKSDILSYNSVNVESLLQKANEIYEIKMENLEHELSDSEYFGDDNFDDTSFKSGIYVNENMENNTSKNSSKSETFDCINDKLLLHKVVSLIKNEMKEIPPTTEYPLPDEMSLIVSRSFVPKILQTLITWLIDEEAYSNAEIQSKNIDLERKILTMCECIIYSSQSGKKQVIPPFHYGLALDFHHQYGCKALIDVLNSYGFCISYDELRYFLTAYANYELSNKTSVYIPTGIVNRDLGGCMIQEGDDNVDMNTETIDGKNTYHAMARVLFQMQPANISLNLPKLSRQSEARSLDSNATNNLQLLFYTKPSKKPRPTPFSGASAAIKLTLEMKENSFCSTDVTWVLLRMVRRGLLNENNKSTQIIPSWTAFNTHFATTSEMVTTAKYLPTINAKPSDHSTMYTTLKKGKEIMLATKQNYQIHTFDQQLYAIAQEITLANPSEFSTTFLRLGGFHSANIFISCINKIWGDAGLQDMLADSGVYACNTVETMLQGKQFHRAIRGLTLCYEVLLQLMIEEFFIWLRDNNFSEELQLFCQVYSLFVQHYKSDSCTKNTLENICQITEESFLKLFNKFREINRGHSKTFLFWDNFLQAVQILLSFIRAERESDWELHLNSFACMLPYYFACNKPNYSRYGSLYFLQMKFSLPDEIREEFRKGNFSLKFTSGPFRGLWSDMGVEMTVIRDTKGDSGIAGFTRKDPSVLRWTIAQNILAAYSSAMGKRNDRINDTLFKYVHEGEKGASLTRDENDINEIYKYVKSHMVNPFSVASLEDKLINISSGLIAPTHIETSLINAVEKGKQSLFDFISSRLDADSSVSNKEFYDPIKQVELKTFTDLKKITKVNISGTIIKQAISAEKVYQRALAVTSKRPEVNLYKVLSYPLTAIPTALFKPDGCKRSTNKADFMHILEKEVSDRILFEKPNAKNIIVIDGMAEIQCLNARFLKTFEDLAKSFQNIILKNLSCADEIHVVFDRYDNSLPTPKQEERIRRYGISHNTFNIATGMPLPDLKKLLGNDNNKSELTKFLCEYLKINLKMYLSNRENQTKKVYLAGGLEPRENTYVITFNSIYNDLAFECNHFDADTRLIFHVKQIQTKFSSIILKSPDTDVFILLLSHYSQFENKPCIYFFTGTVGPRISNKRYIPIHELYSKLGMNLSTALLSAHALTGCDTVSAFFGIGKKTVFSVLQKMNVTEIINLSNFHTLPLDEALKIVATFIAQLYDPKSKSKAERNSITSLRYHLAIEKNLHIDKLPPSEPAVRQHVLRAIWQINEWSQASNGFINAKAPADYGWILDNNILQPKYFDSETSMDLLQKYFCHCRGKTACSSAACTCHEMEIQCCDICQCVSNCLNKSSYINVEKII